MPLQPVVPEYITVHLGPPDSNAENVTLPFIDYAKNVASSEIYPTWPENALRANIYAQITFALNRIYTEWYRSRGYDFDITDNTQYDQKFIRNREIYDSVSRIVDDLFNDYVVRQGFVQPLFTQYCNGTTSVCDGLSQWGTVTLAEEGLTPYQILQNYYGDDINIVFDAPLSEDVQSYPGTPLRQGMASEDIRTIKKQLNRIGRNYPAIGTDLVENQIFSAEMEDTVREFQRVFNLTPDGIVGKATWYRIKNIYNGVKGLAELQSEGLTLGEVAPLFSSVIRPGDTGYTVRYIQYYLNVIAYFDDEIPSTPFNGIFGAEMENTVRAFQRKYGLAVDGIVGRDTWDKILEVYDALVTQLPTLTDDFIEVFPGRYLTFGSEGDDVRDLQILINRAAQNNAYISEIRVDGIFGPATRDAVYAIQANNGLTQNGFVGPLTWNTIVDLGR